MKSSTFHPEALDELQEQAVYYEDRNAGLGERFVAQVEAAVQLAASMPGIGSPYRYNTRRVFAKDFPHSIVYREAANTVIILAVAPFKRKPDYWKQRK